MGGGAAGGAGREHAAVCGAQGGGVSWGGGREGVGGPGPPLVWQTPIAPFFFLCAALDFAVCAGQAWRAGGGLPPPPTFSLRLGCGRRCRRLLQPPQPARRGSRLSLVFLVMRATGSGWWRGRPCRRFPADVSRPPLSLRRAALAATRAPSLTTAAGRGRPSRFCPPRLVSVSTPPPFLLFLIFSRLSLLESPGPRGCRAPLVFDPRST